MFRIPCSWTGQCRVLGMRTSQLVLVLSHRWAAIPVVKQGWLICLQVCIWTSRARDTETAREAITWQRQSSRVHSDLPKLHILISSRTQSYLDIISICISAVGCLRKRPFTVFQSGIQHRNPWNTFLNILMSGIFYVVVPCCCPPLFHYNSSYLTLFVFGFGFLCTL